MPDRAVTGPVSKRQKTESNGKEGSAPLVRQSKIFAPFRVSSSAIVKAFFLVCTRLTPTSDSRPCIADWRSFHVASARKDYLPNHNLGRALPPDIRSQAWSQPRLHNAPADARRHHRNASMEEGCVCGLVWPKEQISAWHMGFPARKEGGGARAASR